MKKTRDIAIAGFFEFGGSVEIRTLEPFRVAGFQDRCLQPLGHASGMGRTINTSVQAVKHDFVQLP